MEGEARRVNGALLAASVGKAVTLMGRIVRNDAADRVVVEASVRGGARARAGATTATCACLRYYPHVASSPPPAPCRTRRTSRCT